MPAGRPTQADVARQAGVSRQLVSLVVRGDPRVSPDRRADVLRALEELGYRPNTAARSLASRRSALVGVVLPTLANPFYGELGDGFSRVAHRFGLTTLLGTGDDEESFDAATGQFVDLGVDGLVLVSPRVPDHRISGLGRSLPVAVLTHDVHPAHTALVRADNRRGTALATSHLIGQGYSPVVFVGPRPRSEGDSVHLRIAGYTEAATGAGRDPVIVEVPPGGSVEDCVRPLVERHGTGLGLVCHDDLTALSASLAISASRLDIGRDIGVTGFDDSRLAALPGVSLTSVAPGTSRMMEVAIGAVASAIAAGATSCTEEDVVLPSSLVIRSSTQVG